MTKGIHRSKAPEMVKEKILEACAELLAKGQSPSIRDVAQAAGVTTGAVQHHFGNRGQMLMAFQAQTVADMEACLQRSQEHKETAAQQYVRASFELFQSPVTSQQHKAWLTAAVTEPEVAEAWMKWLHGNRCTQTESAQHLVARLAADGLWLAELLGSYQLTPAEKQQVHEVISQLAKKV